MDRRTRQKTCHEPSTSPSTTNTAASDVKDGCSNSSATARKSTTVDDPDPQSQASSSGGGGDTSNQPILPVSRNSSSGSTASSAAATSTSTSTQSAPEDYFDVQELWIEKSIRDESSPASSGLRRGDYQAGRSSSLDLLSTVSSESAEYDFRLDGCPWVNEDAGSGSESLMKSWSAASNHSEEEEALQSRVLTCSDWVDLLHATEGSSGVNGAPGGCPDTGAARTNHAFGGVYGRGSTGEISVALSHMVRAS